MLASNYVLLLLASLDKLIYTNNHFNSGKQKGESDAKNHQIYCGSLRIFPFDVQQLNGC
jgi:hypothetical protein